MTLINGNRVMFQQAIDAVNARHASPRARAAFEQFKTRFFDGSNRLALALSHPVVSRRYREAEGKFMLNPAQARTAAPITRSGITLTEQEVVEVRAKAHTQAWKGQQRKNFAWNFGFGLGILGSAVGDRFLSKPMTDEKITTLLLFTTTVAVMMIPMAWFFAEANTNGSKNEMGVSDNLTQNAQPKTQIQRSTS